MNDFFVIVQALITVTVKFQLKNEVQRLQALKLQHIQKFIDGLRYVCLHVLVNYRYFSMIQVLFEDYKSSIFFSTVPRHWNTLKANKQVLLQSTTYTSNDSVPCQ